MRRSFAFPVVAAFGRSRRPGPVAGAEEPRHAAELFGGGDAGAQFWHPNEGGLYLAWYLPLLILTIFRPNLEDRVALSAVSEGWFRWRKSTA